MDAVLSTGEVALLSGAGGMGKSTLTRTVALGRCDRHRQIRDRVRAAGSVWRCSAGLVRRLTDAPLLTTYGGRRKSHRSA